MQYTYDTLLASCQNYEVDNSSQYETEFPYMVQLGEMRIIKDLNLIGFDTSTTGTTVVGTQSISKPSDFIELRDIFLIVSDSKVYLQPRAKSWIEDYWRSTTDTAQPQYYCEDSNDNWLLAPTPDNTYTYKVDYTKRPDPMSSTNQTTWIGNKLGECLFYAVLTQSMGFFKEDVQVEQGLTQFWESTYQREITKAAIELDRQRAATNNKTYPLTKNVG